MISEELIMELTASTPSGGGFWLRGNFIVVRCGPDWWEWKAWGRVFFDPYDLAEALARRRTAGFRRSRPQTLAPPARGLEPRV